MKILILGGYGTFGGRLAELLSDIEQADILIAGRSFKKASTFCQAYKGKAKVTPIEIDRNNVSTHLQTSRPHNLPDIIIDASGPFQEFGDNRYSVVEACLETSIHYLDFADASNFVSGISKFNRRAEEKGLFILSGVSSFPVLTAAVLREMAKDMEITSVEGGIAPSPYAGIGPNVMRAIISYAGGPVRLVRNGKHIIAKGLTESRRFTIAPPGHVPLNNIRFSLVDVPDLLLIPLEHKTLTDIWMGAGTTPESLHLCLNGLAKLRNIFGMPPFTGLSLFFHKVSNLIRFGDHRGGMIIQATGTHNNGKIKQSWHLLAEGDDGPYIPSMAIEAILRKYLTGTTPAPGARSGINALSLEDYDTLFQNRSIHTGMRRSSNPEAPLYRQILGDQFDTMPGQLRKLHALKQRQIWTGMAKIRRGSNFFAKLVGWTFNFPAQGDDIPVTVTLSPQGKGELWKRNFNGSTFSSFQSAGQGRNEHLLMEKFGPIEVALALVRETDRLILIPGHWTFLGIPLPKFLLPQGESFETEHNGVFQFDVVIAAPLIGLIVSYKGSLKPV